MNLIALSFVSMCSKLKPFFLWRIILLLVMSSLSTKAISQSSSELAFEFQAYPTGLIPGFVYGRSVSDHGYLQGRFAYNWIRHRDLGKHDDERGGGFGFSLGYEHFLSTTYDKWFIGLRNDFWWNDLAWSDNIDTPSETNGDTQITVLQPTVRLGYTFLKNNRLMMQPSISFGREWNIKTTGQPTGEGAILLVGIRIGTRLGS